VPEKDFRGREFGMTEGNPNRIRLGGAAVDLMEPHEVVGAVTRRIRNRAPDGRPLAIASANLDHIHHFGNRGASRPDLDADTPALDWLVLLDGVPLVRRAERLTGRTWPQLAGSDLLPTLLESAEDIGARVGFLGGTEAMQQRLRDVLAQRHPGLRIAGMWSPPPIDLFGPDAAGVTARIRAATVDLLVVTLGKPRQEQWILRHAAASGASVLLAFGAATDFLAGTASRAPAWMRRGGLEWTYRLLREPRRLARRYCIQGPAALWALRTQSRLDNDRHLASSGVRR
jgi:N-acetylglucosaminyldiphosphoundecaprenol N-acetyl-beta-D-mannosaminyltransferase